MLWVDFALKLTKPVQDVHMSSMFAAPILVLAMLLDSEPSNQDVFVKKP